MTISTQTLTLMSGSPLDVNDIFYKNKLANIISAQGVAEIPEDFYCAAIYRDTEGGVLAISFIIDSTFESMKTIDCGLMMGSEELNYLSSPFDLVLDKLATHKDAVNSYDAMSFTIVVPDGDEDGVDLSDAVCLVEIQEFALAPLATLKESDRQALQNTATGGIIMDSLPILDKDVTLVAGQDFYQDLRYKDIGLCRMAVIDGQVHLDPHGKHTTIEGTPTICLYIAVTSLADGVNCVPACMR